MVVFDLDGTLCNTQDGIRRALRSELGQDIACEDWIDYALAARHGITPEQLHAILRHHDVLQAATIDPDAREALIELRAMGHHIGIVSDRGWHPDAAAITRDWVRQHRIPTDFVRIVPARGAFRGDCDPAAEGKCAAVAPLTKGHGPIAAYVDDFAEHAGRVRDAGLARKGIVVDRPWNRQHAVEDGNSHVGSLAELPLVIGVPTAEVPVIRHC